MVRKTIRLTESQAESLERLAREHGVSFSEMIRRSVDMLLNEQPPMDEVRRRAMAAVGYARSGDKDVSRRHDDYLTEAYEGSG